MNPVPPWPPFDPKNIARHDAALRMVNATAATAFSEGATMRSVLERVVLAYRGLDLGGPAERALVAELTETVVANDLLERARPDRE